MAGRARINHHGEPAYNRAILKAIINVREVGVEAVFVAAVFLLDLVIPDEWNITESLILRAESSKESLEVFERLIQAKLDIHPGEKKTSMVMRCFPETLRNHENIDSYIPVSLSREEIRQRGKKSWRQFFLMGI